MYIPKAKTQITKTVKTTKKNTEVKVGKMDMNFKYFKIEEFDSPDKPGSAKDNMNIYFIHRLDKCREFAGIPFKITSGYRTKKYHESLKMRGYKTSHKSQHLLGNAVDISTPDSITRYKVLSALINANFRSIGIGRSFIHVDTRTHDVIWNYY